MQESDIGRFTAHFESLADSVDALSETSHNRRIRRILHVSILDTLSRCIYPEARNRERFTRFVSVFCDWPDRDRVSLPHLERLLTSSQEQNVAEAREFASTHLSTWSDGSVIPISSDPTLDEIRPLWPTDAAAPLDQRRISLLSITHAQLLYQYRNSLVHEFREPGHSYDFAEDLRPHYMCQSHPERSARPWEWPRVWLLHYPEPFFRELVRAGIAQTSDYLLEQGIDPYESYVFGDYWYDALNESDS